MSDYRRAYVPGGSFFFTVATERHRAPTFRAETARTFLGTAFRTPPELAFRLDALVLLDEHSHAIWSLPEDDTRYSGRRRF